MLHLTHLSKSFNTLHAVNDLSLTLTAGEILVVLGPSGCGKSTLLALIAGLIEPDRGEIFWEGNSLTGIPTHQRNFGLMFQDYALFPHLNVQDNVAFGISSSVIPSEARNLKDNPRDSSAQRTRLRMTSSMLERVGLQGFEKRDVQTLSGGEQQRVALARALAPRPRLLMLDEPLGALDRALREQLTQELRALLQEFKQTAIYVTHDQQEAFGLADRIAIMKEGELIQIATPAELYQQPANDFVKKFLGRSFLLNSKVVNQQLTLSNWQLEVNEWNLQNGDEVSLLLKAEGLRKK